MLTITQEIRNCEAVLNGETVNGVKLGDKGIDYTWLIRHIAGLREIKRKRQRKAALRRRAR